MLPWRLCSARVAFKTLCRWLHLPDPDLYLFQLESLLAAEIIDRDKVWCSRA